MTFNDQMNLESDLHQLIDRHCQLSSHRDVCSMISKLASDELSKGFLAELKQYQETWEECKSIRANSQSKHSVDLERGSSD